MTFYIGIDPGLSGAFALLDDDKLIQAAPMPNDGNGRVSIPLACAILHSFAHVGGAAFAVVENVASMPKQGVSTTFKFGRAAGVAETLPLLFDLPVHLITPSTWKRHFHLSGKGKDASRHHAIRLWPEHADGYFKTKARGQAFADAALLALAWKERSWHMSNAQG